MNRQHGVVVSTRLTEAERAIVQSAATLSGLSACALVREILVPAARDVVRRAVDDTAASCADAG